MTSPTTVPPAPEPRSAGDPIPPGCELIEIRVAELKQLFHTLDPSPFHERDLDPRAEEFIVNWAREAPGSAPLALVVYLDRPPGLATEALALRDAIRQFFSGRAEASRRRLRQLLRIGRTSLLIGIVFLTASLTLGSVVERALAGSRLGVLLREGLLIGGWVAMWRPIEIFLYDWWPIRAEAKLFDRLSAMPVRIVYAGSDLEAWRRDWPALSEPETRRDSPRPREASH
ncbi:MAG TPA: hypothetical protein VFU40_11550 [Gemmatimonadales bacterium]|nr:hypothetical protein [Gemmatimonadales bacterium]